MDTCHVLGMPWLFDRKVHHDGRENTYEFKKDGKWYKLTPMLKNIEETTNTCGETITSSNKIMLCSGKELKTITSSNKIMPCLDLIPNEIRDEVKSNNIHVEIKPLLDEFREIVVDDLPRGLPPLRSSSHKIDLILRSSIPNKETYRMTLTENEEVNRKGQ